MFRSSSTFALFVVIFGCTAAVYARNQYGGVVAPVAVSYGAQALQALQEADSSALSSVAGAAASAAQITSSQRAGLDQYGHEIARRPLLARPFGPLSRLYAAALPPGNLVGEINPEFVKDSYGNIKHIGVARIGVAVV